MSNFNDHTANAKESGKLRPSRRDRLPNDEEKHWYDVCRAFLCYEDFLFQDLSNRQKHMNRLSNHQASLLPEVSFSKINKVGQAIKYNRDFFSDLVRYYMASTPYSSGDDGFPNKDDGPAIPFAQQHRNKAVLHSIAREWSDDGNMERLETFAIIIERLKQILPVATDGSNKYKQRVLVPGCGVGRLPIEIASEGYATEGNEFSAFMLMAGNFVMNGIGESNSYEICPWLDSVCNVVRVNDPMETMRIPDISAIDVLHSKGLFADDGGNGGAGREESPFPKFSMASGDFVEVYGPGSNNEGQYDAIVTCFFVDTAPVVVDYIETIHHALKKGGVWVNFGPLLYHWQCDTENNGDDRYNQSIELSYEELKLVVEKIGFQLHKKDDYPLLNTQSHQHVTDIDEHSCMVSCGYTSNRKSLMNTNYNAILFSATKL